MLPDVLNIGLGFFEGLALIISPCILPVLPLILAGSFQGSKKRPLGIIVGFVVTFALFTFFSRKLVQYSGIDLSIIRHLSFAILFLLGLTMLSTYLTEKFSGLTQRFLRIGSSFSTINDPHSGFISGVLFGGLVGLVWTPCAGPILAAVIVQTIIQNTTFSSFLIVLSFGLGAAIPMLMIALFGRQILMKLTFFKNHTIFFRKLLGAIIIASVVFMFYGESFAISFSKPEPSQSGSMLIDGLLRPYPAPPIEGISAWINSSPLQLNELKGKVVLIDFWTYSCINCVRTLPYLKDWYQKYHSKGFEIIGVHSPEFDFEKELNNVKHAVQRYGITYPVPLDNQFITWRNYRNRYWPAHYLIDKNGNVVYEHFGEGEYETTENNILFLLGIKGKATADREQNPFTYTTPETYLGFERTENFSSPEAIIPNKMTHYTFPTTLRKNGWALQGDWLVSGQKIRAGSANASLKLHFIARKVFVVMGNATGFPIRVKVLLNGESIINEKGQDVVDSVITVKQHALYNVIVLPESAQGFVQFITPVPGLEMYAFTFGT